MLKKIEKFGPFLLSLIALAIMLNAMYNLTVVNFKERDGQVFSRVNQLKDLEKNNRTIDALYVGESKIQLGISPMSVYETSGLTGINLATAAQPIYLSKELIEVYTEKFNPKVVVLEGLGWNKKIEPQLGTRPYFYKYGIDLLPSKKSQMDFLDKLNDNDLGDDLTEVLRSPFKQMMTFGQNINDQDFLEIFRWKKGMKAYPYEESALGYTNLRAIDENTSNADELGLTGKLPSPILDEDISELLEVKELLDSKGIKLVVVSMPSFSNNEEEMTSLSKKCKEKDIEFIDYLSSENLDKLNFDDYGDFQNYAHLTLSGAHKLSNELGRSLSSLVKPAEKNEGEQEYWNTMLKNNQNFMESNKAIHQTEIDYLKSK